MENLRTILEREYGLEVDWVARVAGGWSADAFVAHTSSGRLFVKVYDKERPSTLHLAKRIDRYLPAVLWLHRQAGLGQAIDAPILTTKGRYQVETPTHAILVFPYINGETLGDRGLNLEQTRQLAGILARLHSCSQDMPGGMGLPREDYSLPFLHLLEEVSAQEDIPAELEAVLRTHSDVIDQKTARLKELADGLKREAATHVLCHTDVHGWNLMWDGRLHLIDWEGLRLALAEADLFVFTDGFFFDDAREDLFAAYKQLRGDYVENRPAMDFYRLRRRLEDISEFACSIARDSLPTEALADSLALLEKECEALR